MFRVKIVGATKEHMAVMDIQDYPFTMKDLQSKFRELTKKYHPDVSKEEDSHKKMVEVNKAYSYLKAFSVMSGAGMDEDISLPTNDPDESIFSRVLSKTCPNCSGKGITVIPGRRRVCKKCVTIYNEMKGGKGGVVALKCRASGCERGIFTLRSGRKIPCRKCEGTGYFKVKCNMCDGNHVHEEPRTTKNCSNCKGTGRIKIQPFNPVIPEGAVL